MRKFLTVIGLVLLMGIFPIIGNAQTPIEDDETEEQEIASVTLLARTNTELLLRAFPDITAEVIGFVPENSYLLVVARSPENDWVQVQYRGGFAWISANWVDIDGDMELLTVETTNTNVTLVASIPDNFIRVLVNTMPSETSTIMGYLIGGVDVEVIAADPGYEWGLINYNGYEGWVELDNLVLNGSRFALPQLENVRESAVMVQTWTNINLRSNPTVLSARLLTIPQGAILEATGRTADNAWLVVSFGDRIGWVNYLFINVLDDLEDNLPLDVLPVVEELDIDGSVTATASFGEVDIMSAPLSYSSVLGTVELGQTVQIVQVDPSLRWGQIDINNILAWVNLDEMNINGNLSQMPVWVNPDDLADVPFFTVSQRYSVRDVQRYFGDVVTMIDFLQIGVESPIAVCALLENDYEPYFPLSATFIEVPELFTLIESINEVTNGLNNILEEWITACSTNTLANNENLASWQQTVVDASDQVEAIEWQLAILNSR